MHSSSVILISTFTVLIVCLIGTETAPVSSADFPFGAKYCQLRCAAKCLAEHQVDVSGSDLFLQGCQQSCEAYNNKELCNNDRCWLLCGKLVDKVEDQLASPDGVNVTHDDVTYDRLVARISWMAVSDAQLYVVQARDAEYADNDLVQWKTVLTTTKTEGSWRRDEKTDGLCTAFEMRVASVSKGSISRFSKAVTLSRTAPLVSPLNRGIDLRVVSIRLDRDTPFALQNKILSNSTVKVTLRYNPPSGWKLSDLKVRLETLVNHCAGSGESYLGGFSNPLVNQDIKIPYLYLHYPLHLMERQCRVIVILDGIDSINCKTKWSSGVGNPFGPPFYIGQSVLINCDTVENSHCSLEKGKLPTCGNFENSRFEVIWDGLPDDKPEYIYMNDRNINDSPENVTISFTWNNLNRINKTLPILYYKLRWGPAESFDKNGQGMINEIIGVKILNITGEVSTECHKNQTSCDPTMRSAVIPDLKYGVPYGVQICAIHDTKYAEMPVFNASLDKNRIQKAASIFIEPPPRKNDSLTLTLAVAFPLLFAAAFVVCAVCFVCKIKLQREKKRHEIQLEKIREEEDERYIDLPSKKDVWELDRRNLIITTDKLGSGAFGAVFKGRILGKAIGHKDCNSSLATNLMRIENCDVAVKQLPEYADELSKSDFQKEINLMKQLGYHEKLVNMLACVTTSDPLCLVVEYCSDGDLMHFLRYRQKYMLKLHGLGIDYTNPNEDDNVDAEMIINLKQLVSFAVQISIGLDYLSSKGFIHRDIAARNVLVHEKTVAKIGDFGLCRYVYGDSSAYMGKGGRLPIKWMSPEAIKNYEFSIKSDVWSLGVLLFEIVTIGGSPYPGLQPEDIKDYLESGKRMDRPDNCPDIYWQCMQQCWQREPEKRPTADQLRLRLGSLLEEITEEYSYLHLDQQRDYYNVNYKDTQNSVSQPTDASVSIEDNSQPNLKASDLPDSSATVQMKSSNAPSNQSKEADVAGFENPVFDGSEAISFVGISDGSKLQQGKRRQRAPGGDYSTRIAVASRREKGQWNGSGGYGQHGLCRRAVDATAGEPQPRQ